MILIKMLNITHTIFCTATLYSHLFFNFYYVQVIVFSSWTDPVKTFLLLCHVGHYVT
jgi:hypothetical protein